MLKVGLLGAGHLGKIHLRLLAASLPLRIGRILRPRDSSQCRWGSRWKAARKAFPDMDSLLDAVEVADIVTPTLYHYECACKAIEKGCHVFLEKPVTTTLEQAEDLIRRLHEKGLKGQVGHVERFNPALPPSAPTSSARPLSKRTAWPNSTPGHRRTRSTDLMIHDLDAILTLVDSPVRSLTAIGACVIEHHARHRQRPHRGLKTAAGQRYPPAASR